MWNGKECRVEEYIPFKWVEEKEVLSKEKEDPIN